MIPVKISIGTILSAALALSVVTVIWVFQQYLSVEYIFPLIVAATVWAWLKKKNQVQACIGVATLCLGSDVLTYSYCLILFSLLAVQFLLQKKTNFKLTLIGKILMLLFVFGFFSYLISMIYEINLLSFLMFSVSFGSLTAPYFYFSNNKIDAEGRQSVTTFIFGIAFVQSLLAFNYILESGLSSILNHTNTPDLVRGTFRLSNDLGYLAFLVCVTNYNVFRVKSPNVLKLLAMLFILFVAYVSDSKTQLIAFLCSIGILLFVVDFYLKHRRKVLSKVTALILIAVFFTLIVPQISKVYNQGFTKYIHGDFNHKFIYFQRTISPDNRGVLQYILGTGPGTCGSRASNARAYDVLYKKKTDFKLPTFISPYSSSHTVNILGDLYTEAYAIRSGQRSALLGNPFNSISAIFIEFGVIGFGIFLALIYAIVRISIRVFNNNNSNAADKNIAIGMIILIGMIIISSFVDQILERGVIMYLFWLTLILVVTANKESEEFQNEESS